MAHLQSFRSFFILFVLSSVLAACGGGGGSNPPVTPPVTDTTPGAYSFVAVTDAARNTEFTSSEVVISGINAQATIAIVGGEYALDGGDYTSADGVIVDGQTITVRATSSSEFGTETTVTLTVGGVEGVFSLTTLAQDIEPDAFAFAQTPVAALNTVVESDDVTIEGLNDAAPISIVGGEYAIGDAEYISEAGTITDGQMVSVRLTSSSEFSTETVATLTIGGVSAIFSTTTLAADPIPDAFSFTTQTPVALNASIDSGAVTIEGLNTASPISVVNGEYAIGDGEFTAAAGTVENGQSVRVRVTASASFSTATVATLTIGGIEGAFSAVTLAEDLTPDAFSYAPATDVAVSATAMSASATINGINSLAPVSISDGLYSVAGGPFVNTAGTIMNGQTLVVQVAASSSFSAETSATVTVGGVMAVFSATTEAADTTPDTFSFMADDGVALSSVNTSEAVPIMGINTDAAISITGGTYSIDGGAFVSTAGTISLDDSVSVRGTAAGAPSTAANVELTIGGVTGTYTITTLSDNTAPTVAIAFPPPSSMTEGAAVTVRGTAMDDLSTISSVQVNGVDVTDTSGDGSFSTWTVSAVLDNGENTLTVSIEDSAGNTDTDAASVAVRRDAALGDFPDSTNPLSWSVALAADYDNNRLLIGDRDVDAILTMDLDTGARGILSDNTIADVSEPFDGPEGLLMDTTNNRVIVSDILVDKIFEVDLTSGARAVISDADTPDTVLPFSSPRHIINHPNDPDSWLVTDNGLFAVSKMDGSRTVFSSGRSSPQVPDALNDFSDPRHFIHDTVNDRLLVVDVSRGVVAVDPLDGARTYFSGRDGSDFFPNADAPLFDDPRTGVLDAERNRILVNNDDTGAIIAVDLTTGVRSMFSDPTTPDSLNPPSRPLELLYDGTFEYIFMVDRDLDGVVAIDITSGERVYVSRGDSAE